MKQMPMISVVLPVFNCSMELSERVPHLVAFLERNYNHYEVIIVDDYSADGGTVRRICDQFKLHYLRNPKNCGKGFSLRRGFAQATGDIWLFMDGDLPFDLEVISLMTDILIANKADICIGDRTLPQSQISDHLSVSRKFGSWISAALMGRIVTPGYYDTQCGVKAFQCAIGRYLFGCVKQNRFAIDGEILYIALLNGFTVARAPVTVIKQNTSSVRIIRDGFHMLRLPFILFFNKISGMYQRYEQSPDQ